MTHQEEVQKTVDAIKTLEDILHKCISGGASIDTLQAVKERLLEEEQKLELLGFEVPQNRFYNNRRKD